MAYQILIVDDDSEFRQEMHEILDGYKVIEASNGLEALAILKKPNAVDLVILDVVMPQMSGIDVLRKIKTVKPSLKIIILTGNSSKDMAIEALKAHADDYVEKPFHIEKFLLIVQTTIENKKKSQMGQLNKMQRIKMFIENNFDQKVSLQHVADEVCLSPKYLSRLFKEQTGTGFNEYRLKIKIQKAADLLRTTHYTVNQISIQLGYKNSESFIRMFEKLMKKTPTQYRQQKSRTKA